MIFSNVCFEKYNEKDWLPCFLKRYDGPHLPRVTRVISSVHGTFCGSWKQEVLKMTFGRNLIGRKSRAYETIRYVICGKITQFLTASIQYIS